MDGGGAALSCAARMLPCGAEYRVVMRDLQCAGLRRVRADVSV